MNRDSPDDRTPTYFIQSKVAKAESMSVIFNFYTHLTMGAFFVPLYGINYKEAIKMSERTLEALRNGSKGKIHIYLRDEKTAVEFLTDAENEGYRFGKIKPTENHISDIIALEKNKQLSYVTFCGRVCFQSGGGRMKDEGLYHRIDYAGYKNGDEYSVEQDDETRKKTK